MQKIPIMLKVSMSLKRKRDTAQKMKFSINDFLKIFY